MNTVVKKIAWGGDPDKADDVTGLTKRDIYHIRKNWKLLYANPEVNGELFFKNFMKADPDVRSQFASWKKYPDDSLFSSPEFKSHVQKVLNAMNSIVTNLENPDALKLIMKAMGEVHADHKIPKRQFYVFKEALYDTLKETIDLQQKHASSWDKLFDFLYAGILPMLGKSNTAVLGK